MVTSDRLIFLPVEQKIKLRERKDSLGDFFVVITRSYFWVEQGEGMLCGKIAILLIFKIETFAIQIFLIF